MARLSFLLLLLAFFAYSAHAASVVKCPTKEVARHSKHAAKVRKACIAKKHRHKTSNSGSSSSSTSAAQQTSSSASEAAASSSSSASSPASTPANRAALTPAGGKAGVGGGQSLRFMNGLYAWMYDWGPDPRASNDRAKSMPAVSMLWGVGERNHDNDAARFAAFQQVPAGAYPYVAGFNEMDFVGEGSSGGSAFSKYVDVWNNIIVPKATGDTLLISPSSAYQAYEKQVGWFIGNVTRKPDILSVHIFQDTAEKALKILEHYRKYKMPMWITELACINYEGPTRYCSQDETNTFWQTIIPKLEADKDVYAYAVSDANNGPNAALTTGSALTTTGNLIKSLLTTLKARAMPERRHMARMRHVRR